MDWSDERYVRLYTRDTATWNSLEWEGQTVLMHLLRKLDRAGVMDFQDDVAEAIRHLTRLPMAVIEVGLPRMIKKKVVEVTESTLVFINFIEAQEAQASPKHRAAEYRARRRDMARRGVTKRDGHGTKRDDDSEDHGRGQETPPVTKRDDDNTKRDGDGTKRDETVTPSLAKPSRAVPSRDPSGRSNSKTGTSSQAEASDAGARGTGSNGSQSQTGEPPSPPVRKRTPDDIMPKTFPVKDYVPLPAHDGYAEAIGLTTGEARVAKAELIAKFADRGLATAERWDARYVSFLERAAQSKREAAPKKTATPVSGTKPKHGPMQRAFFGNLDEDDEAKTA